MGIIAQAAANVGVNKLVTQLVLDNKQFSIGMKDSEGKMVNLGRVGKTLGVGIAAIGTGMAATFTAAALLTKQTVAQGDKFEKLSQRIGISVEKLSAYEHVANLSGTSVESMGNSVARLSRNMLDTSEGIGEAKDAFKRLGIEVTDSNGKLKSADDVMLEMAARFEEMPDGAEKTALSMQLMGRAGKEMIPMLNQGTKGMKDMLKEGKKLRGWTTAQAKEAALLNDNYARVTTAMKGAKDAIGKELIPVFQAIIQTTQEWMADNEDLLDNTLARFPEIIREYVIPAFAALMETGNTVVAAIKIGWEGLQIAVKAFAKLMMGEINLLVQGFAAIGSKIPGVGKTIKGLADTTQAAYDAIDKSIDKNVENIDNALNKHKENKDKITALQDSIVIKYGESHKRMNDANVKFNDAVLTTTFETYDAIDEKRDEEIEKEKEAAKERQELILGTEAELRDKVNEFTLDKFTYAKLKLDEEYEIKKNNVEDRALLDEWYALESGKIQDKETKANKRRTDKRLKEEQETYEEQNKFRLGLQKEITDAIIAGGDVEQAVTEYTKKAVIDTLQTGAKEKLKILMEAAVKVVTGHVAEGLSMVGASSTSWVDALLNVGLYAAGIAAQIGGAKAIANNINFAGGGWLGNHPQGGVINQGSSSGTADDVFMGSQGNHNIFASRGESVFVMNAGATKRYSPILSSMNMSTGFASGGELLAMAMDPFDTHKTYNNKMSKSEQVETAAYNMGLGLAKSAVSGWAMAGDWIQGIPPGIAAGAKNIGATIPGMFLGKLGGKKAVKNSLGFGLGGFLKAITNPIGYLEDKAEGVKDFIKDPWGTIVKAIKHELTDAFKFDDIRKWIEMGVRYTPGIADTGAALMSDGVFSMPKLNLIGDLKKLTIDQFLKDSYSATDMLLPFHNGGVLGSSGMMQLGPNEVPFAGVGQKGEMLLPPDKVGNNVNVNITLNGIDRANARTVVNDYIIPELNFYLTSKGGARI